MGIQQTPERVCVPPRGGSSSRWWWGAPPEVDRYGKGCVWVRTGDDRLSRRLMLIYILLPGVGKKHWAPPRSWQRTASTRGTNTVFWALRFLGRTLGYLELPGCEEGHEIILVFIFSHSKNMPHVVLFLEPPVQICGVAVETVPSIFIGSFPTTWRLSAWCPSVSCVLVQW